MKQKKPNVAISKVPHGDFESATLCHVPPDPPVGGLRLDRRALPLLLPPTTPPITRTALHRPLTLARRVASPYTRLPFVRSVFVVC